MMQDDYLLQYSKLEDLTIAEFISEIKSIRGKNLSEIRLMDLTYHNGEPISPGEGVYLFRIEERILYVGKASSMSFIERIGKHLDFRNKAWFNRLLKLIHLKELKLMLPQSEPNFQLLEASNFAFEKLNLVLINFASRERIARIERLLRATTNPLNKFNQLKSPPLDEVVKKY